MHNTTIIAFAGIKGSGKDTAAAAFEKKYNDYNEDILFKMAFADPLKSIIHRTFEIDNRESEEIKRLNIRPFNGLTLREVYQNLGEEIKFIFGQNIWVDYTLSKCHSFIEASEPEYILITDLRYINEEKSLREFPEANNYNLYIIKLVNTNQISDDKHISEIQIDLIKEDFIIKASNIEEIKNQIGDIYNAISK